MFPLFEQCKSIVSSKPCLVCYGNGYEIEAKDSDSTMKVHCCGCGGTGIRPEDIIELATKTASELKDAGIDKMNRSQSASKTDALMEEFIEGRLWEARQPDSALGNGWNVYEFTIEDLRQRADRIGGFENIHPNSWGALLSRFAKADKIKKTGEYVNSKRPSSHSRIIPVWEIIK